MQEESVNVRSQDARIGVEPGADHAQLALFPPVPGSAQAVGVQVRSFVASLELALQVRSERRSLSELDERTLKDLGFNRGDACAEADRSFWDLPVDRLRA